MKQQSPPHARILTREEQLDAQARLREYYTRHADRTETLDKSTIAKVGKSMWAHTYGATSSDEVALEGWGRYVESLRHVDPERHYIMSQQRMLADAVILMLGGARWFGEGLPVYRPGHRRTASFMATNVSVEMAEHVKPPYRAFYIELPDGLVEISGEDGTFHKAIGVFVHVTTVTAEGADPNGELPPGEYWRWLCLTRSVVTLWEMNRTVGDLIAGTLLPADEYYGIGWEMTDHDLRVRRLITRLIVSLCLDLASGKELRRKVEPSARSGKKASKVDPSFNVLLDPSEVDVDARPYVRAFLSGNRKSPDFQQLVTGHWKNQAYGPRLSLRKPIHIAPYKRLEHLPEKMSG